MNKISPDGSTSQANPKDNQSPISDIFTLAVDLDVGFMPFVFRATENGLTCGKTVVISTQQGIFTDNEITSVAVGFAFKSKAIWSRIGRIRAEYQIFDSIFVQLWSGSLKSFWLVPMNNSSACPDGLQTFDWEDKQLLFNFPLCKHILEAQSKQAVLPNLSSNIEQYLFRPELHWSHPTLYMGNTRIPGAFYRCHHPVSLEIGPLKHLML